MGSGHDIHDYRLIKASHKDGHQTAPGYVIAILPFANRDTFHNKEVKNNMVEVGLKLAKPIIILNDAVSIHISHNKSNPVQTAEINLLSGNINYSSAVSPGDHALIWLLDNASDYQNLVNAINAPGPKNKGILNGIHSGLKFVGRVNSVRQVLQVNPEDGSKVYRHIITMAGFGEMMTQIYFNELLSPNTASGSAVSETVKMFIQISDRYLGLFNNAKNNGRLPIESVVLAHIDVFMGMGPKNNSIKAKIPTPQTPNASFLVPTLLAQYLGLGYDEKTEGAVSFKYTDLLHKVFGVQKYGENYKDFPKHQVRGNGNYYQCNPLKGGMLIRPMNFNNITFWSLLTSSMNPALNEIYTTLMYLPDKGGIYPTIVLRQFPFSTKYASKKYNPKSNYDDGDLTYFTELPRWKLDSVYPVLEYNIGTSDAERFNFFQLYTNNFSAADPQLVLKAQIAVGNFAIDSADVIRTGPRIYSSVTEAEPTSPNKISAVNDWVNLIADCFSNGHLKMNGSIKLAGVQEPICIGDNFEFDNKLFHIEGVEHTFQIEPTTGKKQFTTTLMLSHGYYINANGEIEYMSAQPITRGEEKDKHLPGYTSEYSLSDGIRGSAFNSSLSSPQNPISDIQNQISALKDKLKSKIGIG